MDADEATDIVPFGDAAVQSQTGEHLGTVEGFIVDWETDRPYYIVVNAGGWFSTKEFLLPVGHAGFDAGRNTLVADLPKSRVERFPGFDRSEFPKWTGDELKRFNDETLRACSAAPFVGSDPSAPYTVAWNRPDYQYPDWWTSNPTRPDRMGSAAVTDGAVRSAMSAERAADRQTRAAADPSPHHGGRAQPGDVLGIETGGERTYIGETAEDENKRREEAERTVTKR
jgi:hypothetical protein